MSSVNDGGSGGAPSLASRECRAFLPGNCFDGSFHFNQARRLRPARNFHKVYHVRINDHDFPPASQRLAASGRVRSGSVGLFRLRGALDGIHDSGLGAILRCSGSAGAGQRSSVLYRRARVAGVRAGQSGRRGGGHESSSRRGPNGRALLNRVALPCRLSGGMAASAHAKLGGRYAAT